MVVRRSSAVAALAAAALAGCGDDGDTPSRPPPAPSGFSAAVQDEQRTRPDGLVAWRADWELSWRPVPGASGYDIRILTSEGAGSTPRRVRKPQWRIEVANGVNPRRQVRRARDQQLTLMAAQLQVDVAARFPDGRTSTRQGPFAVGEPIR